MIIAVALNPAIDQTVEVDHFHEADTNRVLAIRYDIGGKGINVARALKEIGCEALATGFAAGQRGRMIEDQLLDSGIGCDFVDVPGETRTNITILDRSTHRHTQLALAGPLVSDAAGIALRERLRRRVRASTWLVLAGSIPPPGDAALYVELIRMTEERGGRSALDADGPVVEAVLASGVRPTLLKINEHELERLLNAPATGEAAALAAARQLHVRSRVERVVVTLGAGGAVAVSPEGEFVVTSPDVEVVSAVGAGDAFLAGLMYGLVKQHPWQQALELAAAAGSAACLTPGTLLCQGADVWRLLPGANAERLATPAGVGW